MSYRIQYTHLDGTLTAVVSGRATHAAAGSIARDIAAQAAWEAAARVLIDLRWLEGRVGMRALLTLPGLRVAVLDIDESAQPYVFGERDEMKLFASLGAAMRWLRADARSPRGDRKATAPAGAPFRAPLAILGA